jgi:hypothetical protein
MYTSLQNTSNFPAKTYNFWKFVSRLFHQFFISGVSIDCDYFQISRQICLKARPFISDIRCALLKRDSWDRLWVVAYIVTAVIAGSFTAKATINSHFLIAKTLSFRIKNMVKAHLPQLINPFLQLMCWLKSQFFFHLLSDELFLWHLYVVHVMKVAC